MDTTLHAIYDDMGAAEQAARRLVAAGISPQAIRMIAMGERHVGGFADSEAHMHTTERDHVGGFADSEAHMHTAERDHVGSFADSEAHMHTAERDHVGSFASSEARGLIDELAAAGLAGDDAQAYAGRIAGGNVALVVRAGGEQAERVRELLGMTGA
jgi:hypothetical protein